MRALPISTAFDYAHPTPDAATMATRLAALRTTVADLGESPELDVASAATIDAGGLNTSRLRITGSTTISSLGSNYRGAVYLRMAGSVSFTHSATLQCPNAVNLLPAVGDVVLAYPIATAAVSNGWALVVIRATPVLQGYTQGGTVTTPGASINLVFAAGQVADSTNAAMITTAAVTKTTAIFAVGAGGGLDTGVIANNATYYDFFVRNPATGATDRCISLSETTPTLTGALAPFTQFRRGNAILRTNGSAQWAAAINSQVKVGVEEDIYDFSIAGVGSFDIYIPNENYKNFRMALSSYRPTADAELRAQLINNTTSLAGPSDYNSSYFYGINASPVSGVVTGASMLLCGNAAASGNETGTVFSQIGDFSLANARVVIVSQAGFGDPTFGQVAAQFSSNYAGGTSGINAARNGLRIFLTAGVFSFGRFNLKGTRK